jgi:hypothetical protein
MKMRMRRTMRRRRRKKKKKRQLLHRLLNLLSGADD